MSLIEIITFLVIIASSSAKPEDVFGREGSFYIFNCPYTKPTSSNVLWNFINISGINAVVSDGNFTLPSNPAHDRIEIVGNHSKGEYNLKLSDLQGADEGVYKCTVGEQFKQYNFGLLAAPSALVLYDIVENKIWGTEGKSLTINCTAIGGKPPPDIRLDVDSKGIIGKQSVYYTIPDLQMHHDKQLVKCEATSDAIKSPTETEATLYLYLKPSLPVFDQDPPKTNDTQPLVVSCTSTGSRPAGVFYWKVKSTAVTVGVVQRNSSDQTTDIFTMVSTLTYNLDKSYNEQEITCGVTHQTLSQAKEATTTICVYFAPDVTVSNETHKQTDTTWTIQCNADGNPTNYTYYKWQHKSVYGKSIRKFDGGQNGKLTLPIVAGSNRYQDSGEYICTVGNGIGDTDGKIKQTGHGYLTVNAQPVFTLDNGDISTQYGEFGKMTDIHVYVYSVPKYTQVTWYKGNVALSQNSKYGMTEMPALVVSSFHGVTVQLDGFQVTLTINNLVEGDFTTYKLSLTHGYGQAVEHSVVLESASAPQTPSNFSVTDSSASSISFEWDPGFNGGHDQTFYVEYRVTGSTSWSVIEIPTKQQTGRQKFTLSGLEESTSYEVRMYAENQFNKSLSTDVESILTVKDSGPSTGAIIGGVAGGLLALIVVIIIGVFFLRKRDNSSKHSKIPRSTVSTDSEVEDGLKDNILYDGNGLKDNILYKSADRPLGSNSENAEVEKKPAKASTSNSDYAEVQKPNAVYAEVDRKAQQKNAKAKKQKGKKASPKKQKDKALNNNPGDVYANAELPMENMEGSEYANAEPRNGATNQNKNPQGLEYADLTFVMGQQKNNKPLIHGEDDRTIYSDVDHTKKAPPPPPESEYEETNIRHGKA